MKVAVQSPKRLNHFETLCLVHTRRPWLMSNYIGAATPYLCVITREERVMAPFVVHLRNITIVLYYVPLHCNAMQTWRLKHRAQHSTWQVHSIHTFKLHVSITLEKTGLSCIPYIIWGETDTQVQCAYNVQTMYSQWIFSNTLQYIIMYVHIVIYTCCTEEVRKYIHCDEDELKRLYYYKFVQQQHLLFQM